MNKLKVIKHPEFGTVRTEVISNEVLFSAKDVCTCLGLENSSQAISRLDEDEKGVIISDTLGGKQQLAAINESGLYNLIFQSRKPEARMFRKWVTSEILPALRKYGKYELSKMMIPDELPDFPQGHVFSADYIIIAGSSIRRVIIDGRPYYCLVDIQLAAGMENRHRSQLSRSVYRNYTFKIVTKTNRRPAAYISAEGVEILFSRSKGEKFRRFLAEFLEYRGTSPFSDVNLAHLLEIVVRTSDNDDRLFLYALHKRLLNS